MSHAITLMNFIVARGRMALVPITTESVTIFMVKTLCFRSSSMGHSSFME